MGSLRYKEERAMYAAGNDQMTFNFFFFFVKVDCHKILKDGYQLHCWLYKQHWFFSTIPTSSSECYQVVRKIKEGCVWIEILLRGQSPEGVGSGHWGRSHWKVDETLACHGCRRSSHKGNLDLPHLGFLCPLLFLEAYPNYHWRPLEWLHRKL